MKIAVVGVPFNGDGTPPEIENPPQSFRDEGLIALLENKGHHVTDIGDLFVPSCTNERDVKTMVLNFEAWKDVSLRLSRKLVDVLERESFPIVIAGDCSILMGIFDAYEAENSPLNLFFLDGHADFHDTSTTPTGEPADMELAALTGYLQKEIVTMTSRGPLLDEKNVVAYGLNEYDLIETSNIAVIDRRSILDDGIESTFYKSLSSFQDSTLPIWLHFDVDVLNKEIMPAIHYPVENGLSYDEALELFTLLAKTRQLVGISIACYHPNLDHDKSAIRVLLSLLDELIE